MRRFKEAIKQDIIGFLFLCFLLGGGFIWLGGAYGFLNIDDAAKINGTVLWLTALAIFWYAYETYQLKKSTADQAAVQEEIMLNEFLPILEPLAKGAGATLKNNDFSKLFIRNLGKGPAKYIEIYIGRARVSINWSLAGGEEEAVRMDAASRIALRQLTAERPEILKMKITYQDIYGRKFQTDHIVLERVGRSKAYSLRQGTWDFVQKPGKPGSQSKIKY